MGSRVTVKLPNLAWIFDGSPIPDPHGKGEAAVKFIKALKHPKSRLPGNAFQLDPWQERITRKCFGDTDPDGQRKVRELLMIVGRGNRKSSLMAAYMLLFLIGPERRPYSEIVSAANSRKQAAVIFDEMAAICRATPRIFEAVRIQDTLKAITYTKHHIRYVALSSDAKNAHGLTPIAACIDELAESPKDELIEAIETGLNKSANTILFMPTTAGIGRTGPLWAKYEYAKKIVDGALVDDTFMPLIFETPLDADWKSDEWLEAANPGLPYGYPDREGIVRYRTKCENLPAERARYERRHLCKWLDGAAEPAWDLAIWDQNAAPYNLDELAGAKAWIGVDLSRQIDLTAVATAIEMPDGKLALHVQSFCPEEGIRKRAGVDSAPYPLWAEQGFIAATPGDIVDLDVVEAHIREMCERFDVAEIAFDRHLGRDLMRKLDDDGLPVVEFPQTLMVYAPAVSAFERAMFQRHLCHGGNPLLRWAISNVVLYSDANNNRRPDKKRAPDRIDPAVASIMAVGRALANDGKRYLTLSPEELLA